MLHTWKDTLWQSGSKTDPPPDVKSLTNGWENYTNTSRDAGILDPASEHGGEDIASGIAMGNLSIDEGPGPSTEAAVGTYTITVEGSHPSPA